MLLSRVRVSNFRGIRDVRLDLDETTVLIGENSFGKTSVLDAIRACLGVPVEGDGFGFKPRDFPRPPDEPAAVSPAPIEIELRFDEQEEREWSLPAMESLAPAMTPGSDSRRQLTLRVVATNGPGRVDVATAFLDEAGKLLAFPADDAAVSTLRQLCPFLLIGAARYFDGPSDAPSPPGARVDPTGETGDGALDELERRVEEVFRKLTTWRGPLPQDELDAGVAAAGEWIDALERRFPASTPPERVLRDLVETPARLSLGHGPRLAAQLQSSGTQSLGILVMLGALFRARGGERLAHGARPIVAIEEPEAHLHPLMLASAWGLLAGLGVQKLVTTNSGEMLAAAPLTALRRLGRPHGETEVFRLREGSLASDERRRVAYHIRIQRGSVFFARCWLLVEGQTEFWLLPELARLCGQDLAAEGVACVEFAQCGPAPLVKLANDLGIEWYLFTDGDEAGKEYVRSVLPHLHDRPESERITLLKERDVEHCLWRHGYERLYREAAGGRARAHHGRRGKHGERPGRIIERAVRKHSKPGLALRVTRAAAEPGSPGVPAPIREAMETVVRLARSAAQPR